MVQITASEVNRLRKQTGAGMMDCKKALVETNGDFDQAIDVLRKKGQKVAAKRADRETTEGTVLAIVNKDNNCGVVLSLNCETDFVAKNENFISLTEKIINLALDSRVLDIESLKSHSFDDTMTIGEKLLEQTGVIGEKLEISNYHLLQNVSHVTAYVHPGNKLASLVGFNISFDGIVEVGKNVAMQIAAMNPLSLSEVDLSQDIIEKELEIGKDLARQEGKPENMLEQIAKGRLKKFFKENTLLNQVYIKDSKKTIAQYLKDSHLELSIVEYKRVNLG